MSSFLSFRLGDLSSYRDLPFAVLFLVQLLVIFSLAMASIPALNSTTHAVATRIIDKNGNNLSGISNDAPKIVGGMFLILFIGGGMALGWIWLLSRLAKDVVTITFGVILIVTVISALSMFFQGLALAGIFSLIVAVVSTGAFVYLRPRLEFATVNMRVACEAIKLMPALILSAGMILFGQVIFSLLWMMAVVGYATNDAQSTITATNGVVYKLTQCSTYQYSWPVTMGDINLVCPSGNNCQACVCEGTVLASSNQPCFTPSLSIWAYLGLLLHLLWTSEVLSNIMHVTTAGAISAWWFHSDQELMETTAVNNPDVMSATSASTHALMTDKDGGVAAIPHHNLSNPSSSSSSSTGGGLSGFWGGYHIVRPAMIQALTTSFGSICLGSLAVAILRILRTIVYYTTEKLRGTGRGTGCVGTTGRALRSCALACMETALRWIEAGAEIFNRYAFCYVAIYSLDFQGASKSVVKMFGERGWTALINDDIVDVVLTMGNIIGGVHLMYVGYGYAHGMNMSGTNVTLMTLLGLFSGYLLFQIAVKVVSSAVATIYVCFAERPDVFEVTHPELHRDLQDAWFVLYPNYKKMSPYDAEAVEVPPTSSKAFAFTFPTSVLNAGGGGVGVGGAGRGPKSAPGGWNTYRPPTEEEVLAATRGAAAAALTGDNNVAGSTYRPLFVSNDDVDSAGASPSIGGQDMGHGHGIPGTAPASFSEIAASAYTSLASMVPTPMSRSVQYSYEQRTQPLSSQSPADNTNERLHRGEQKTSEGGSTSGNPQQVDEETVTF